jgi:uncharacterized protein YcfJ
MNNSVKFIAALILGMNATAVIASDDDTQRYYNEATVIDVDPIIRTVQVTVPQRECYTEEVRTPVYQGGSDPAATAVVGGVVGGILGHKLSHGRGGATVAGTLIGAAIGNELGKANAVPPGYHEEVSYQDRCEVRYLTRQEQHTEGYRVTYRYKGAVYHAQLPHDPGKRLRVQVSVTPVDY